VAVWIPGQLKLSGPGDIECRLRDIGTGGACIQTSSPIGVGDLRWLQVELPDGVVRLPVSGKWQKEAGPEQAILTGVAFEEIAAADAQRIEDFVHERLIGLSRQFQNCPELPEIGLDEAMDLALVSRYRTASAGRYLFLEGSNALDDSVFLVVGGAVAIEVEIHGLRFSVDRVERGSVFGGISLLAPSLKPSLSAMASRDVTLLEVDRESYAYLRRAKPVVANRLHRAIVEQHVSQLQECIARVVQRLG
jgi:CRP-like cAMP-binding protein